MAIKLHIIKTKVSLLQQRIFNIMASNKFKLSLISSQILLGSLLTISTAKITKFIKQIARFMRLKAPTISKFFIHISKYVLCNLGTFFVIQSMMMFLGEFFCLPIFLVLKFKFASQYRENSQKAQKEGKKLRINKLIIIVPAICDLISSTLHFIALNYISASAYQMLTGGNIVATFILSILFLHQPIRKNHLFGSIFAFVGILVVGVANVVNAKQTNNGESLGLEIFGYFLMFCSFFTVGFQYTFQQKILTKYYIEPLQMVGYEGLFGFTTYILFICVLSYIPCNWGTGSCVYTNSGEGYMENWGQYIDQTKQNLWLILLLFLWVFGVTAFNPIGVSITKYMSAGARAISDVTQTILCWIIGTIVTLTAGNIYPSFKWERFEVFVVLLQLLGFLLIILGNLTYNQIIDLHFLKFQKNTAKITTSTLLITEQTYDDSSKLIKKS